ncbi:hypothetical protein J3Q64DRAFT_1636222, partial [Phycomyces blakesleeanus]
MSSLLAILLVVNSTRGHHYVFSYPADPKRPLSTRDRSITDPCIAKTCKDPHYHHHEQEKSSDEFAGRDAIFNMDVGFLADALAPKPSLCDRKFQLSIDDLTFVGHPV